MRFTANRKIEPDAIFVSALAVLLGYGGVGPTIRQIAAVTGWAPAYAQQVIDRYLPKTKKQALEAVNLLETSFATFGKGLENAGGSVVRRMRIAAKKA